MTLQAITGQLTIVDGVVQEAPASTAGSPGMLAQPAPRGAARGRARDFLFVHLTLSGPLAETAVLRQDFVDIISDQFFKSNGSVTAALRQAVLEANQRLLRRNLSSGQSSHAGAITCAALHNGELYTVQAGESWAMIGRNYGIERLPPQPSAHVTPLGRSSGLDLRYYHHRLQAGDTFLLGDPRLAHLSAEQFQHALVDMPVEDGIDALTAIIGQDTAQLLLVEFSPDAPLAAPDAAGARAKPTAADAAAPPVLPQPRRAVPEAAGFPAAPQRERQPQPVRPSPSRPRIPTPQLDIDLETSARRGASQAAMGLSRFTGWLAALIDRLRAPGDEGETAVNWLVPTAISIVIPLLVVGIAAGVYLQRGQVQELADLKQAMALNLGLAEQAGSEEEARAYYDTVVVLAQEADTTLRPGDGDVLQMRRQAQTALDELDDITRLEATLLYEYPEGTQLTAVVVPGADGGSLYTLDRANNTVYRHAISIGDDVSIGEPEQILFGGQAVGNHVVVEVVDLLWRPAGSDVTRDGLAMLDSSGALISYYPDLGDTRAAPLGAAAEWLAPRALTTYSERLYILDNGAQQIWKYFPSGDQFDVQADDRAIAFAADANPTLNLATDIALYSADGSLLVSYEDGRLRYYDTRSQRLRWDEAELLNNGGLRQPLGQPVAVKVVGSGLNTSLFVADVGSGRILQINQGGRVLIQHKATAADGSELYATISDFAVLDVPRRIIVTAGNKLFLTEQ